MVFTLNQCLTLCSWLAFFVALEKINQIKHFERHNSCPRQFCYAKIMMQQNKHLLYTHYWERKFENWM